jgi:hypothetical protein
VRDQKVRDEGIQKSSPSQLGARKYRGDEAPLTEKTRFARLARLADVSEALTFQAFEDRSASNLLFTLPSAHRETISDSSSFRNCEKMKQSRRAVPTV